MEALKDTHPGKEISGFSCHNNMDAEFKSRSRQILLVLREPQRFEIINTDGKISCD